MRTKVLLVVASSLLLLGVIVWSVLFDNASIFSIPEIAGRAANSTVLDRHDDYDRKTISHWADNMKAKGVRGLKLVDYEFGPKELNLEMAPPKLDADDEATARLNHFSNEVFGARILAVNFCSDSGKHYGNWKINVTFNGVLKVVGWDCTRDVN